MPDIDDHMDELFKKAAENYPLKTNAGNFDDLMPFITRETATTAKPIALTGKRKTTLLWLVLLLTGATIGTYLINNTYNNKTANDKVLLHYKTTTSALRNTSAQLNVKNDEAVAGNTVRENMAALAESVFQKNRPTYNSKEKMFTNIMQPDAVTDENTIAGEILVTKEQKVNKPAADIENKQRYKTTIPNPVLKKENTDKSAQKIEPEKEESTPALKKNKNKPGFYYGIAAGIELNKVKTQDITKAGFNGGIILGLQINKKIAVETGVQLSQKKYYSDGKYFNPKSGSMPSNMTVNSLESKSTIIEIPVSIKYDFSKKTNTLYGKVGVSSYIITKESNKYQAVVSGQQQEVNSTYKSNHGYLASDVRIGVGYQHSLNKKINMRIEPYIQVPLKGIGVGSLPVTSTGLQLVLTRN